MTTHPIDRDRLSTLAATVLDDGHYLVDEEEVEVAQGIRGLIDALAAAEHRATRAESERDEWRQTALDEQGAALDLLEVIKDRDQRIERVRGLMNHNDNIDNVPIDDLLHALDGDA